MNDQTIEQEIQAKGKTAPRVTPADIEKNIASEYYFTAGDGVVGAAGGEGPHTYQSCLDQLTFCVLVLRNGTKIVGINYGSINPEDHSEAQGRFEARAHAIEQIWPLMGYALREQMAHGTWLKAAEEETTG